MCVDEGVTTKNRPREKKTAHTVKSVEKRYASLGNQSKTPAPMMNDSGDAFSAGK